MVKKALNPGSDVTLHGLPQEIAEQLDDHRKQKKPNEDAPSSRTRAATDPIDHKKQSDHLQRQP